MYSKAFAASTMVLAHLSVADAITTRITTWESDATNECDSDPTLESVAGHYVWKHDGQNTNGDMFLRADGTLDQYHANLAGSTWYINANDQVVLEWPWDHVLTRAPNSKDWFMNSRNPPSKLEWVADFY